MPRPPLWKTPASPLPAILAALEQGATLTEAAGAGNVAPETLLRWMEAPEVAAQIEAAQGRWKAKGPGCLASAPSPAQSPTGGPPYAAPGRQLQVGAAAPLTTVTSGAMSGGSGQPTPRDRWAQVHEDAARLGPGLYGYLLWLEGRIADHNRTLPQHVRPVPPMPAPLLEVFRLFFESGKQELLILGGRGLGKSTMFCRPTVIENLFGPPVVNDGEIAIWPELSVDMDEAGLKLPVLKMLLKAAGLREDPMRKEDDPGTFKVSVQQRGRSRIQLLSAWRECVEIRVYPATVEALSGPTLKGARHDEEQKWRANKDKGTSSAEDVIDSEGAAFRGQSTAHLYRISSSWSTNTPHHRDANGLDDEGKKIGTGDTPDRMVARIGAFLSLALEGFEARARVSTPADAAEIRAFAATLTPESPCLPSWFCPARDPVALKARNVRVFLREYGSKTSASGEEGDAFDGMLLDAAEQRSRPEGDPSAVFVGIDTGAKKNPAAFAAVGRWDPSPDTMLARLREGLPPAPSVYAPLALRSWTPSAGVPLDLRLVVLPAMAALTIALGASTWSSDGYASDQIELVAAAKGIRVEFVATSEAWRDVYAPVADGLARGEVALSGCPGIADAVGQLRRVSTESVLGADGARIRVVVPEDAGGEHGDVGVALVRALAAAGCGRVEEYDDGEIFGAPGRYAGADPRAAGRGYGGRMRA